jgi:hypothetical protein
LSVAGWPLSVAGWPLSVAGWPLSVAGWPLSVAGWPLRVARSGVLPYDSSPIAQCHQAGRRKSYSAPNLSCIRCLLAPPCL